MSPEVARNRYDAAWRVALWQDDLTEPVRDLDENRWWLLVDAASLALDLAVAEASRQRVRASVAW